MTCVGLCTDKVTIVIKIITHVLFFIRFEGSSERGYYFIYFVKRW